MEFDLKPIQIPRSLKIDAHMVRVFYEQQSVRVRNISQEFETRDCRPPYAKGLPQIRNRSEISSDVYSDVHVKLIFLMI